MPRCYLRWGDVVRLLRGRYPSVLARTGSCATPVELSLPSAFSLVPRVLAGCIPTTTIATTCYDRSRPPATIDCDQCDGRRWVTLVHLRIDAWRQARCRPSP